MATVKLGTKRICSKCSAKFYDLEKEEIICPKCDTVYDLATTKLKRKKINSMKKPSDAKQSDKDLLVENDTETPLDDVLEDTSDLETGEDLDTGGDIGIIPTDSDED